MAIAQITKDQRAYVENDIKFDEDQYENKVSQIKDWFKKQPHLPQVPDKIFDKLIRCFLIGSKLSTEKVKRKLDLYYTARNQIPDLFQDTDPRSKEIRDSIDKLVFFPLSELTPEGIRVNIAIINGDKDDKFTAKHLKGLLKRVLAINSARHQQGEFWAGEYIVIDAKGFFPSHITELPWSLITKFFLYIQDAHPLRLKGTFIINSSPFVEKGVNIVKPMLNEKSRNRIQVFQGDYNNLYKFIPKRILPKDYGGEGPSVEESNKAWQQTLESMADLIVEDEKYITDETKRPNDSDNKYGQMFGINGTFNKLNID